MTNDCEFDRATCPVCEREIEEVSVRMLRGAKSKTPKKFWVCGECGAILGST